MMGGQPLPPAVLQKMEAAFNTKFADVRVRVGPEASSLGALAFTHGSTIYFAPGHYNPQLPHGQRLLAHELAHVVQQRSGRARNPFGSGIAVVDDHALEAEAQWMSHRAAALPVVQRASGKDKYVSSSSSSSEPDDSDDGDYVAYVPKAGAKKVNPHAKIDYTKKYEKTSTKVKYTTIGGSEHVEVYDPVKGVRTTTTNNLKPADPQFRSSTKRPSDEKVGNPWGLSVGQSTLNQNVVSHFTPSWMNMPAGGEFSNSALTSGTHNSRVNKVETKWHKEIEAGRLEAPFSYTTTTTTIPLQEAIDDDDFLKNAASQNNHPHWNKPERIKARLENKLKMNPNAVIVVKEERTLTDAKKRTRSKAFATDYHYGIPARAHSTNASSKYKAARGADSDESDDELLHPNKKQKKGTG
jgi:hypothetical protein